MRAATSLAIRTLDIVQRAPLGAMPGLGHRFRHRHGGGCRLGYGTRRSWRLLGNAEALAQYRVDRFGAARQLVPAPKVLDGNLLLRREKKQKPFAALERLCHGHFHTRLHFRRLCFAASCTTVSSCYPARKRSSHEDSQSSARYRRHGNGVSLRSGCGRRIQSIWRHGEARAFTRRRGCVSDHGLRGLRTCALAVPLAALLAAIGLGAPDGGAQSGGTYCDAAYCYVLTCERRPAPTPACRYVSERVCRPVVKQECTTRNVQRCHTVTDQACQYRSVNECKSVNRYVCKPAYKRVAEAQESAAEGAQPVGDVSQKKARPRLRTVRRPYHPYRPAAPQQQRRQNTWAGRPSRPYPPYNKPDRDRRADSRYPGNPKPSGIKPGGSSPNAPNRPAQQCSWQMQSICAPVAKQECRPVTRQVCNDYPEQSCYPRQVQDCHEERRQVCDPAQPPQEDCRRRPVQRPCMPPQYWTPQGCVTSPAPTLPSITDGGKKPIPNEYVKPPTDYGGPPPTSTIKPGNNNGPDTAKLEPLPAPYERPKAPDRPPPREEPPAPPDPLRPPEARRESSPPPSPAPTGPTIDVKLNDKTWRIVLDPVPIATGAGLALLLGLLALWPKRKDVPTDADQLARLGIECRVEPDLGEQAVTHLERPPVGPRITVRATPGSRRHGIVMR